MFKLLHEKRNWLYSMIKKDDDKDDDDVYDDRWDDEQDDGNNYEEE